MFFNDLIAYGDNGVVSIAFNGRFHHGYDVGHFGDFGTILFGVFNALTGYLQVACGLFGVRGFGAFFYR